MRKNSIKNIRINSEVQRELSNIIRTEVKDPRIHPMTSVVAVNVAPTLAGLKNAEGYIRRALAKSVNLRNTPEIKFILDQSIEYGVHMTRLIDEVVGEDAGEAEDGSEEETDSEEE